MTLDRGGPHTPSAAAAFCFLDCEENLETTTPSRHNISSLSIFKKIPHAFSDNDISEKGHLIASLTVKEPRLSHVSDSVKVDGLLEAKRSTLHIAMLEKADCMAAYTCEVRTTDSRGNVLVGINRLRQKPFHSGDQDFTSAISSALLVQLMSLVHQLDTKLALISQSSDMFHNKLESIERRLDNRLWSIERRLNTIEPRLENKIESLRNEMGSIKDQISSNIERCVVDKLCQLDTRTSMGETRNEDLTKETPNTLPEFSLIPGKIEGQINNISKDLGFLQESVFQLQGLGKKNHENLKGVVSELSKISSICEVIPQTINNGLILVKNKINSNKREIKQLKTPTETMSYIRDICSSDNATITSSVKSAVTDLLLPKSCKRGMSAVVPYSSFPYPVVFPNEESGLDVPYLCDTFTDGGGWIILQRRSTGHVDFYRDWGTYKEGFGSLRSEFWLGNDKIYELTKKGVYELRIEMTYKGRSKYASYDSFAIGDEHSKYTLRLGRYSGTAGDSLRQHNREPFSTYDKDHDLNDRNCAEVFTGAWWYKDCHHSNLNGKWQATAYKGPNWKTWTQGDPVSYSEIKIRRKD